MGATRSVSASASASAGIGRDGGSRVVDGSSDGVACACCSDHSENDTEYDQCETPAANPE